MRRSGRAIKILCRKEISFRHKRFSGKLLFPGSDEVHIDEELYAGMNLLPRVKPVSNLL